MKPTKLVLTPTRHRRLNELIGLIVLVAAALLFLSLLSYHSTDPSFDTVGSYVTGRPAHNWVGLVGANFSDLLLQIEGIAAFCFPVYLGALGYTWMRSQPTGSPKTKIAGLVLFSIFASALAALLPGHMHWANAVPIEGLIGRLVADELITYLNFPGACVVAITLVAISAYLSTTFSFNTASETIAIRMAFLQAWKDRWKNWKRRRQARKFEAQERRAEAKARKAAEKREKKRQKTGDSPIDNLDVPAMRRQEGFAELYPEPEAPTTLWDEMPRAVVPDPPPPAPQPKAAEPAQSPSAPSAEATPAEKPQKSDIAINERADADLQPVTVTQKHVSGYKLPPSSLLFRSETPQVVREDKLREEAQILVEKCGEFDVRGQVVQINPGPVVTTFEFKPDAGVKYSRVTGLAEDLCLAMSAESILIERMAGKSTVGIQVPNEDRDTIWLRDIIESETFIKAKSKLTLAMGKDINGRIVTADLATMPHVLIAGSTGSGKSVAINAMIMSVLYRSTPEQVRMILVDPKRVELGMYDGIPHLFTPIITEPKLAANALKNAVREMERRLKLLASRSVRNIDGYNKLFENAGLFDSMEEEAPLPYILIIIDELADLMMLDKANVEEAITRLAQMARAVGIHLVLATQRPSVDVITGLIKANVPTRISFRLATKVDSRTILDSNGAESLLGRGDMLFLPPGTSRVMRLHAPFVTEKETAAVVDFWKSQGQAQYVEAFLESPKDEKGRDLGGDGSGDEEDDELFDDAVRLVFEFGKASTSLLQRRLRIGYGRAAHLIDMMERDGLVGPADGSKPREILKSPGWLNETEESIR
jgi:DNA segregation ATPase FtsK/SpoIIIE, S-DNA-T family